MASEKTGKTAPHGMEPFDSGDVNNLGALSSEQQHKHNQFKMKTRMENESYLRDHPEVQCLVSGFLREVLIARPKNVQDFAAGHFTDSQLPLNVENQLEERQQIFRQNRVMEKIL